MNDSLRPTPMPSAPPAARPSISGGAVFLIAVGVLMILGHLSPELKDRVWALLLLVPLACAVRRAVHAWHTLGRVSKGQVVWVLIAAILAATGVERLTGMNLDGWLLPLGVLGLGMLTVLRRQ